MKPAIATVDQIGNVKAISEGTTTITVVTENGGYTASCEIIVAKGITPVTSVRLDRDKLELVEGRVAKLTATVLPENATNKNVT
ncbi:Ig domain-containing protein [Methanobrevibacter sp.]|uniref:Ig-like domain-containing protein n=1 Tax=Methanobrevibacter sp. TaxID=66852 RepID=UPI0038662EF0